METLVSRRQLMAAGGAATALAAMGGGSMAVVIPDGTPAMKESGLSGAFAGGKYVLPELPYAYDALEPAYDAKTLQLHYQKHHSSYVETLNTTLGRIEDARKNGDFSEIKPLSREMSFAGSGHVLHTLFWYSMAPKGSMPSSELEKAMNENFGSVAACKAQFAAATKAVEGSGWGLLAYEPIGRKMLILQIEKHQNLTVWGVIPILTCDVWEHAYYLKYKNDRAAWVDAFMTIANWQFASERLVYARTLGAGM
jgi:superoxide dismutase, Fe-Mn family